MHNAIQLFRSNLVRVRTLGGLYTALSRLTTPAVDSTDILRAQIVLTVSALDYYIHDITRIGMVEVFSGTRTPTNAFKKFQITLGAVTSGLGSSGNISLLEEEVRERHGFIAFQHPDKIADAIRLFSSCSLWSLVAAKIGLSVIDLKNRLKLIVDRRNKIAHEADLDPSYPGTRWPISPLDVESTIKFIEDICEAIYTVVK
jgi:hypothetical protein